MEKLKQLTTGDKDFDSRAEALYSFAQSTYEAEETQAAEKKPSKEKQWLLKMLDQGTASDKISALS